MSGFIKVKTSDNLEKYNFGRDVGLKIPSDFKSEWRENENQRL